MAALPGNAYYAYFANQLGGGAGRPAAGGGLTPLVGHMNSLGESVVRHGASVLHDVVTSPDGDIDSAAPRQKPKKNRGVAKVKRGNKGKQVAASQRGRGSGTIRTPRTLAVQSAAASRAGGQSRRPRSSPAQSSIRDIFSQ